MKHRKCLLIACPGDGPVVWVKKSARLIVEGLPEDEIIHVNVDDAHVFSYQGEGEFPLVLRESKVQVTREEGSTPITVFLEND